MPSRWLDNRTAASQYDTGEGLGRGWTNTVVPRQDDAIGWILSVGFARFAVGRRSWPASITT